MNITVTAVNELDVSSILDKHGLGNSKHAWLYAGARFKAYCDRYVPFRQGTLKNTAVVGAPESGAAVSVSNGAAAVSAGATVVTVKWVQPYAHYQYYGKTMGPNVLTKVGWRSMAKKGGKYYTGGSLTYSHLGRGDHWDRRMLGANKQDLLNDIAAYVGGQVR